VRTINSESFENFALTFSLLRLFPLQPLFPSLVSSSSTSQLLLSSLSLFLFTLISTLQKVIQDSPPHFTLRIYYHVCFKLRTPSTIQSCRLAKRERSTPRNQERRMEESSTWRSRYQSSRCWSQLDVSSTLSSLPSRRRLRKLTLSLEDDK